MLRREYMSYFLPHLAYRPIVWIHCGNRNADKLESLNESILRFHHNSSYEKLLENINKPSLRIQRIHDMLVLVYLALNRSAPDTFDLLVERLHSFSYYASKSWNSLPDNVRTSPSFSAFKTREL